MTKSIVLAGGCFWCTEAVFKMIKGVVAVNPGYTGGQVPNPTYDQICGGKTGHAEAVKIDYDEKTLKIEDLLTIFFGSHDPTTLNKQGNDVGTQYRSAIFYTDNEQKDIATKFIQDINDSNTEGKSVVTEVSPLDTFYEAEDYHKDYFARHPGNPYCEVVINPKLEKVQAKYANLLNNES